MKLRSPIVTLLVGLLIAIATVALSVKAKSPEPAEPYGLEVSR